MDLHSFKEVQKLLSSYLFHRAANLHQRPALDQLVAAPPFGHCALLVDFKELLTLPLRSVQAGEMFFATARHEVTTFGAVLVEHGPSRTPETPCFESKPAHKRMLPLQRATYLLLGPFPVIRIILPPVGGAPQCAPCPIMVPLGGGKTYEVCSR